MSAALICIGGLLGVGKTTIADELSRVLANSVVICPDRLRLCLLGKNPGVDVLRDEDITQETTRQVIELMREGRVIIYYLGRLFLLVRHLS